HSDADLADVAKRRELREHDVEIAAQRAVIASELHELAAREAQLDVAGGETAVLGAERDRADEPATRCDRSVERVRARGDLARRKQVVVWLETRLGDPHDVVALDVELAGLAGWRGRSRRSGRSRIGQARLRAQLRLHLEAARAQLERRLGEQRLEVVIPYL